MSKIEQMINGILIFYVFKHFGIIFSTIIEYNSEKIIFILFIYYFFKYYLLFYFFLKYYLLFYYNIE